MNEHWAAPPLAVDAAPLHPMKGLGIVARADLLPNALRLCIRSKGLA